jgi:hypothetical protein
LAPQQVLDRWIEAVNALEVNPTNWAINSSIIDALKILGALDNEAEDSRSQVKSELESVHGDDDDAVDNDLALSLCLRMFDHSFDSIYGEEIYNLDEELRRRLYRRALRSWRISPISRLRSASAKGSPNIQAREDIKITDIGPIVRTIEGASGEGDLVQRRWSWSGQDKRPGYNFRSVRSRVRIELLPDPRRWLYEFTDPSENGKKRKGKWLFTKRAEPIFCIAGI